MESTVGKDIIREGSWNPEKPNRLVLTLRGGVKVRSNSKIITLLKEMNMSLLSTMGIFVPHISEDDLEGGLEAS